MWQSAVVGGRDLVAVVAESQRRLKVHPDVVAAVLASEAMLRVRSPAASDYFSALHPM